ncbi:MAG: hypothetical protein AABX34_02030 [Nanoarchaeota archaeon]
MSLDEDLLKIEKLFSFRFDEEPNYNHLFLERVMITPEVYSIRFHPEIYLDIKYDEQKRSLVYNNISVALIHSIGFCFSDKLEYGRVRDRQAYLAYVKRLQELIPVTFVIASEEPEVYCARGVKEFLQSNLDAVFSNIETAAAWLGEHKSVPLKKQVRAMNASDLLSGKASYPEKPRSSEFGSLEEYIANCKGEVRIGDVIYGVELTDRHKKSGSGAFTLHLSKYSVRVIVQGSNPNSIVNVQISEKINNDMYRANLYSQK